MIEQEKVQQQHTTIHSIWYTYRLKWNISYIHICMYKEEGELFWFCSWWTIAIDGYLYLLFIFLSFLRFLLCLSRSHNSIVSSTETDAVAFLQNRRHIYIFSRLYFNHFAFALRCVCCNISHLLSRNCIPEICVCSDSNQY